MADKNDTGKEKAYFAPPKPKSESNLLEYVAGFKDEPRSEYNQYTLHSQRDSTTATTSEGVKTSGPSTESGKSSHDIWKKQHLFGSVRRSSVSSFTTMMSNVDSDISRVVSDSRRQSDSEKSEQERGTLGRRRSSLPDLSQALSITQLTESRRREKRQRMLSSICRPPPYVSGVRRSSSPNSLYYPPTGQTRHSEFQKMSNGRRMSVGLYSLSEVSTPDMCVSPDLELDPPSFTAREGSSGDEV